MAREYDQVIVDHYRNVARESGASGEATMADETIRARETEAILAAVGAELQTRGRGLRIADVGCGNGYTLERLAAAYPGVEFTGFEFSPDLRALAEGRFAGAKDVRVFPGDIRERGFHGGRGFDVVVCQRVLINLLNAADQKLALDNLAQAATTGALLVFIEAFDTPLAALNAARAEFELPAIPPAHHNLYLEEEFFAHPALRVESSAHIAPPNFLSTHYFVSRVLHPLLLGERPFKRNSHLVRFFTNALPPATGDYGPLRFQAFRRLG